MIDFYLFNNYAKILNLGCIYKTIFLSLFLESFLIHQTVIIDSGESLIHSLIEGILLEVCAKVCEYSRIILRRIILFYH